MFSFPNFQQIKNEVYGGAFDNNKSISCVAQRQDGGEAIASGGYGCVFRPALKCQGENKPRKHMISKLLKTEYANEEMDEINKARDLVKDIPNYEKYFAVTGYDMCVPAKMTDEDKKHFSSECRSPLGTSFSEINESQVSRSKFRIISSPDLGLDVSKSISKMFDGEYSRISILKALVKLNNTSTDLLKNAITKMAKLGFYHSDIKPQNILTDFNKDDITQSFNYMKVIDFGLALPKNAEYYDVNTHVLFNYPFSSFMFSRSIIDSIDRKIERAQHQRGHFSDNVLKNIGIFVNDIIANNDGHIPYMKHTGSKAYGYHEDYYVSSILKPLMTNYCAQAILTHLKTNKDKLGSSKVFDIEKYWNNVYRYNLDVWGLLFMYFQIAANAKEKYPNIADDYLAIVEKYLYTADYAGKVIPVSKVVADINKITKKYIKELPKPIKPKAQTKKIVLLKPVKHDTRKKLVVVSKLGVKSRIKSNVKSNTVLKGNSTIKKNVSVKKNTITLVGKRCPKGYRRHKTMKNKCVKN